MSISDCKQAIDTRYKPKYRQGLLIKHIQELAKSSNGFVSSIRFTLVGGGMQQLSAECISDSKKCINTGQKLAEKEPLDLKYSVPKQLHATRKLHACISTPWKKKYAPLANFKNSHRCLISWYFYDLCSLRVRIWSLWQTQVPLQCGRKMGMWSVHMSYCHQ